MLLCLGWSLKKVLMKKMKAGNNYSQMRYLLCSGRKLLVGIPSRKLGRSLQMSWFAKKLKKSSEDYSHNESDFLRFDFFIPAPAKYDKKGRGILN